MASLLLPVVCVVILLKNPLPVLPHTNTPSLVVGIQYKTLPGANEAHTLGERGAHRGPGSANPHWPGRAAGDHLLAGFLHHTVIKGRLELGHSESFKSQRCESHKSLFPRGCRASRTQRLWSEHITTACYEILHVEIFIKLRLRCYFSC